MGFWEATSAVGLHYVSGQVPRDQSGEVIEDNRLEVKIAQAMANVNSALEQVCSSVRDLVYVQIHLDKPDERWPRAASTIREQLAVAKPAATVIAVGGLMNDKYMVEISGVAADSGRFLITREGLYRSFGRKQHDQAEEGLAMDIGCSEVVRVGPHVFVSGRMATDDDGDILGGNDIAVQCQHALKNLEKTLHTVGASMDDVVSNQIFLTSVPSQEDLGRICEFHNRAFGGNNRPTSTMVCVAGLLSDEAMVEITAVAVIGEE
jgi:enamine deaminase RidA (YjgF/YER057c/UK114 family)